MALAADLALLVLPLIVFFLWTCGTTSLQGDMEYNAPSWVAQKDAVTFFITTAEPVTQNSHTPQANVTGNQAFHEAKPCSSQATQLGPGFTPQTWGLFFTAAEFGDEQQTGVEGSVRPVILSTLPPAASLLA